MNLKRCFIILAIIGLFGLLIVPELLNYFVGKNQPIIGEDAVKGYAFVGKLFVIALVLANLYKLFGYLKSKDWRGFILFLVLLLLFSFVFKSVDYSKFYLEKKISTNTFNEYKVRFNLIENNQFQAESYFQGLKESTEIKSMSQLSSILLADFEKNKELLFEQIHLQDPKLNFAVYLMGFVSQAWAYGNIMAPSESGCVFNNEHDRSGFAKKNFSDYLGSKIGCCTYYAYFLKALLDQFKIENKLVLIRGHIFNEILIAGKSFVLDANINALYTISWKDIVETDLPFEIVSFPHAGMDKKSKKYRPIIGHFKQKMYWLVNTRYSFFEYQNSIPENYALVLRGP